MAAKTVTIENFQQEVLGSGVPVLVDFWAGWCGPCRMVSPLVDELADEHPEYAFCKVNVDEQPDLANQYKVMSIPNLVVFKDGKVVAQSAGAKPKEQILEMVRNA
ncbi:MAG: thioredoxin [Treponemataceae bacterium]|nr:thioredoxin [Treponemataceae bacterium]